VGVGGVRGECVRGFRVPLGSTRQHLGVHGQRREARVLPRFESVFQYEDGLEALT
jgi:hypothetical protein